MKMQSLELKTVVMVSVIFGKSYLVRMVNGYGPLISPNPNPSPNPTHFSLSHSSK